VAAAIHQGAECVHGEGSVSFVASFGRHRGL
jgi:hypothetical protein